MSGQSNSVQFEEMAWPEIKNRIGSSAVFVPAGSIEQHGPHLPVSTDLVIAEELSIEVARHTDGLVAPPLNYGYRSQPQSGGGQSFTGTINLRGETYQNLAKDVLSELVADGAEHIVIIPGHGENEFFLREAVDLHLDEGGEGTFMIANWWDLLSEPTLESIYQDIPGGFPGWNAEHAGIIETSLMQHFSPEMVDNGEIIDDEAPRAPPYVLKPTPSDFIADSGTYYKATFATPEIGRRVSEDVVDQLTDAVRTEFDVNF